MFPRHDQHSKKCPAIQGWYRIGICRHSTSSRHHLQGSKFRTLQQCPASSGWQSISKAGRLKHSQQGPSRFHCLDKPSLAVRHVRHVRRRQGRRQPPWTSAPWDPSTLRWSPCRNMTLGCRHYWNVQMGVGTCWDPTHPSGLAPAKRSFNLQPSCKSLRKRSMVASLCSSLWSWHSGKPIKIIKDCHIGTNCSPDQALDGPIFAKHHTNPPVFFSVSLGNERRTSGDTGAHHAPSTWTHAKIYVTSCRKLCPSKNHLGPAAEKGGDSPDIWFRK